MSTPTVLPAAALSRLAPRRTASPGRLLRLALLRVALYALLVSIPLVAATLAGVVPSPLWWGLLAACWCGWSVALAGGAATVPGGVRRYRWRLAAGAGAAVTVLLASGAGMGSGNVAAGMGFGYGTAGTASGYRLPPALVPLIFTLPLLELWIWRHLTRVAAGLMRYDDRLSHLRYVRSVGWTTLAALLPPLVAGMALAGTATRLPYELSGHPDAPALVLAMACGVLLVGVVATGWLLATRGRPGLAATVAWCPVAGTVGIHWGQPLLGIAIALAAAYATGLVLAAYVLFDARARR